MDPRTARLEARIQQVKAGFLASLPETVSRIRDLWNSLRHAEWTDAQARELQIIAHRLAGSGGTFGFPEVTRLGAGLDAALGAAMVGGTVLPETILAMDGQVEGLIRVVRDALITAPEASGDPVPLLTQPVARALKLVVVIDDDEFLRERLSILLEGAGYRVVAFEGPAQAMPFLQEHQPAMVVLDLMFPGRRGPAFDVVADIRGETGQRTPVVVLSGQVDFRSRLDATRAGADAYLVKPVDDAQLLETAASLTSRKLDDSWRCLVIDDDEHLARQVTEWLEHSDMVADWAPSARDSWLKVREFRPDVLVLDINMPECNGIEYAQLLRQDANTAHLPIVFMTADAADITRRKAMAAGADDYILKPIDRSALTRAVLARARLGRRVHDKVARLTRQSSQGGGVSRHYFFNELERVMDHGDDSPVQPALLLLALNASAAIAERHGVVGLAALQEQFQTRLASAGAEPWTLLGENIVGILLPRDTMTGHQPKARSLISRLSAVPYRVSGEAVPSGVAAALLQLRQGHAVATVLSQAGQMLNLALDGEPGVLIDGFVGEAESVEVSGSLPQDRLRLVYQAVATIDEEAQPVYTVLARLVDSGENLLPAGRFLEELEKKGLLPELDAWVFRSAHRTLTERIAENTALTLMVHVSAQSLGNAIYMETVASLLADQPMRHAEQKLVVAVPESVAVTHRHMVERLSQMLAAGGGGLMLTAYGSSAMAARLVAELKPLYVRLDDALVQRLSASTPKPADRSLLAAAVADGAMVVAGGIESAASLSGLWAQGVRWFQGYYIQEPALELPVR
ncbi:PleD family two-component response regulator [Fluviicoccus keumensis]|uniref:PleD family two-component response regulator n=1 Tax=Fluviicoccus keumensis TaxID=1435465 RepID=A0A4Q7ZCG8_9GAMM|nr:response regulator [Fluviicoccus keumensis]RZU47675.1 PleD family two-component response regulator [Fluviicoccus keumensis]